MKFKLFKNLFLVCLFIGILFSQNACDEDNSSDSKYSIDDSSTTNLLSTGSSNSLTVGGAFYTIGFTVTSNGIGSTFKIVLDTALNLTARNVGSFTQSPSNTFTLTPTSAGFYSITVTTGLSGSGNITFYVDGATERVRSGFTY